MVPLLKMDNNYTLVTFERDCNYEVFAQLMKKLETLAQGSDRGFWFNRSSILRKIKHLTVVLQKEEVVAFYVISHRKFDDCYVIDFMQVFSPGKGLGSMLLRNHPKFSVLCVEQSLPESVGFWDKLNIPY